MNLEGFNAFWSTFSWRRREQLIHFEARFPENYICMGEIKDLNGDYTCI